MAVSGSGKPGHRDENVADLLQNLNLTAEEGDVAAFSDDEEDNEASVVEWTIVAKVLSPATMHANTIYRAMKPTWGNPFGLNVRTIGEKEENLFVAEFNFQKDMEWALAGSPWMVGRHALILQNYDERLSPSEVRFVYMDIWVRILNLPLGWMNQHRCERAMSLIGAVKKMEVDRDGKASGSFLLARVAIEVVKPLRRGCY
ncbi:uncharacterized protein [Miscanthus floridulus]|uniref:uncharacterized protein n=1 Tax=Miscanthus floridulus TaxID=154761 RepID=UPI00345AB2F2